MRVVHVFDRYLNSTMNWAWQLIRHTPDTEPYIAAPLILDNQFRESEWKYLQSPWQGKSPASEWEVPAWQHWQERWLRPLYWRWLSGELTRIQPDLIHAHFAQVGVWALPLARKSGAKLVVSFYGYDYEQLPLRKPAMRRAYQRLFAHADLLLTEGPHGAKILMEMGCPKHKIALQPLGIDLSRSTSSVRLKKPGQLQLVQAASFTAKKGYLDTLDAFALALPQCPGMQLTLVGEPLNTALVKQVDERIQRLPNGAVQRLEFVNSSQFHKWLQQFDVFIHPSKYAPDRDCEGGAPVVLLDAQQMGLPVIATRHCDIPQVVRHNQSGLLCDEGDVSALAEAIRLFYNMSEKSYHSFSQQAIGQVATQFDLQVLGKQLRALYEINH